jgi:hypothetical protein
VTEASEPTPFPKVAGNRRSSWSVSGDHTPTTGYVRLRAKGSAIRRSLRVISFQSILRQGHFARRSRFA